MEPLDTGHVSTGILQPSARHVAHVLQEDGPLRFEEIVELTQMPDRTARAALNRLQTHNLVQALPDGENKRYKEYYWNNE